jgi:hypothetical protein
MKPHQIETIISQIFCIQNTNQFNELALQIFHLQYQNVKIYRDYCDVVVKNPQKINTVNGIPFLPIQFFKSNSSDLG